MPVSDTQIPWCAHSVCMSDRHVLHTYVRYCIGNVERIDWWSQGCVHLYTYLVKTANCKLTHLMKILFKGLKGILQRNEDWRPYSSWCRWSRCSVCCLCPSHVPCPSCSLLAVPKPKASEGVSWMPRPCWTACWTGWAVLSGWTSEGQDLVYEHANMPSSSLHSKRTLRSSHSGLHRGLMPSCSQQ